MKLGINLLLWTAAADESHFPLLEKIKGWGFDGVELPMFSPDASPWKAFKTKLDDLGMTSTVVCVLPEDASLIADDSATRARGVDTLKASIDACRELGAQAIAGPLYHPVGALTGRGPTDDERKRCIESLAAVAEHTGHDGPRISVEPLNRFETYFLNAQQDAADVAAAVGHDTVGILYDTFHANIEEKDPAGVIKDVAKQINHVHISANDRATPGEDHVDWPTTFANLKAIGYDGWLTIEAFGAWLPEIAGATCIWRKMAPSDEHIAKNGAAFVRDSWARA
jgi:D-psicose/D-tagatose/L-ribulose 3-epimerase